MDRQLKLFYICIFYDWFNLFSGERVSLHMHKSILVHFSITLWIDWLIFFGKTHEIMGFLQFEQFLDASLHFYTKVSPCVHPSVRPSIRLSIINLSIQPSVHPSIRPSIPPSVHPSVQPFVRPSIRLSIPPSICPALRNCCSHFFSKLATWHCTRAATVVV